MGYATLYTMAPVFSLVLDQDVSEEVALLYPELYKELTKVCVGQLDRRTSLTLRCRVDPFLPRRSSHGC